ncbi:hypothetical protein GCM10023196_030680 [Actinoallomurus vinaceus]|uniref:Uncharacterized protein n=1 Tax=Actinoallomurus vinaceus TaxID=1080074 RepID=A0ABP8U7G9_9ACTN
MRHAAIETGRSFSRDRPPDTAVNASASSGTHDMTSIGQLHARQHRRRAGPQVDQGRRLLDRLHSTQVDLHWPSGWGQRIREQSDEIEPGMWRVRSGGGGRDRSGAGLPGS